MQKRPPSDHVADLSQILRLGTIASVDLESATCTVEIGDPDDENVTTTQIQWGVLRAGKTSIWSPPSTGEQVLLFCPDGDIAQAVPLGALYSTQYPAPGSDAREFIRFADGAEVGYDPEAHHFDIDLPAGATAEIDASGGITLRGDTVIEGDLTVDGDTVVNGDIDATGDVSADGISLKTHPHSGVQPGEGLSGEPQ